MSFTIAKIEHFQKEWLPFFNSQKRRPKIRVEESEVDKLKKKTWKPLENEDVRVEQNEPIEENQTVLIKDYTS